MSKIPTGTAKKNLVTKIRTPDPDKIHPNQFGYKRKTSCKNAYYIVNETTNYYRQRNTKLYVISLDASKAFDKLWRNGLFFKLMNVLEACVWRILYRFYNLSQICVNFNGCKSDYFRITEGVKQGGILSPYLFNFYINDLIKDTVDLNLGANICNINVSIVAYCDDIAIMSPLASHAQQILDKIFQFSLEWKIEFNAKKSSYLCFTRKRSFDEVDRFMLGDSVLPLQKGIIYLGLPLGDKDFIDSFMDGKMRDVEKCMFSLYPIGCKPRTMRPTTTAFLYKQFCQSILRYSMDILYFSDTKLKELDTRQNILIKNTIGISKFTHTKPLYSALKLESITQIYLKHKVFFLNQILNNNLSREVFLTIRKLHVASTSTDSSYNKQLRLLEFKLSINCLEYEKSLIIDLINDLFMCANQGLIDSINYYLFQIDHYMSNNLNFYFLFDNLNFILMTR